jgi:hypothetical protein
LRPRWQHLSSFWGRLLSAARRDDREALYDLDLQAFQISDADSGLAPSPVQTPLQESMIDEFRLITLFVILPDPA